MFQNFSNWKVNILCIIWFNVSKLFIPYTYTQNSLLFNSLFLPLAFLPLYICLPITLYAIPYQIHTNRNWCYLPSIFQRHLPTSKIVVSSNPKPYELATTKEGGLHFILSNKTAITILILRSDVVDLWVLWMMSLTMYFFLFLFF